MTAEITAFLLLAAVLAFAVVQPYGLAEATAALPAAGIILALGILSPAGALAQLRELGPTVGFLATVLVLAHLADVGGVFDWLGDRLASASGGCPRRLLAVVFLAAAATTAVLSLDATVVLLTPVVFGTATRLSFLGFAALMAAPWLASLAVEFLSFQWFFATDLTGIPQPRTRRASARPASPSPSWA